MRRRTSIYTLFGAAVVVGICALIVAMKGIFSGSREDRQDGFVFLAMGFVLVGTGLAGLNYWPVVDRQLAEWANQHVLLGMIVMWFLLLLGLVAVFAPFVAIVAIVSLPDMLRSIGVSSSLGGRQHVSRSWRRGLTGRWTRRRPASK